jgi:hypothetical protein
MKVIDPKKPLKMFTSPADGQRAAGPGHWAKLIMASGLSKLNVHLVWSLYTHKAPRSLASSLFLSLSVSVSVCACLSFSLCVCGGCVLRCVV